MDASKDATYWRDKLAKVNDIVYANGAPLGGEAYFRIREIASEAVRERHLDTAQNDSYRKMLNGLRPKTGEPSWPQ